MVSYKDRSAMIVDPANVVGLRVRCFEKIELKNKFLDARFHLHPLLIISWAMYCLI